MTSPAAHHVVVVGAGSIGERHIRCFLATGRARVSFVETILERRDDVARRYPAATALASVDAAVHSGAAAAVIATPAPMHVPMARQLISSGMHVLIEKPLAVSMEGVEELRALAQFRGVVAAVAYVYRAHPALAEMRSAIASGRFGKPLQLVITSGQDFAFYRPAYRQTYYASRAAGGGAVQDALTHLINAGEWLVGPVERLVADAAHLKIDGVEVEDTVHVIARHSGAGDDDGGGGGVLASYSMNQHQSPNETTITLACERGTARFEYHNSRWRFMTSADEPWIDSPNPPLERDALFVRQASTFLDAMDGGPPPPCPLTDGIQTLKVNLAILRSVVQRGWQSISSVTEERGL
jgi:predicted dehydrogenase